MLGSATPALESWYRAQQGEYQLICMKQRVLDRCMPDVATIDLRNEFRHAGSRGALSRPLQQAIRAALLDEGQVILLLNRRGFSTHIQCPACGSAVRCEHCDIALTHHRDSDRALCHYCNYQIKTPDVCPDCGFAAFAWRSGNTEAGGRSAQAVRSTRRCCGWTPTPCAARAVTKQALDRFRRGEVADPAGDADDRQGPGLSQRDARRCRSMRTRRCTCPTFVPASGPFNW